MINQLIVLANNLDQLGETDAADVVDSIAKSAVDNDFEDIPLTPLIPDADEIEKEEKTAVDFFSQNGPQLVSRVKKFFIDNPDPSKWSDQDRKSLKEVFDLLVS